MGGILKASAPVICATENESLASMYYAVFEHRMLVQDVFDDMSSIFSECFMKHPQFLRDLMIAVSKHDMDKLIPDIAHHYSAHYFPVKGQKYSKSLFVEAARWHRNNNPHHVDYWYCKPKFFGRERLLAVLETACDWEATSENLGHSAYRYYLDNSCVRLGMPSFLEEFFRELLIVLQTYRFSLGKLNGMVLASVKQDGLKGSRMEHLQCELEKLIQKCDA